MLSDLKKIIHTAILTILRFLKGNGLDWFPIRDSFKQTNRATLSADLRAALNVSILCISQGIAFAVIADLPIHYGILCAAIAPIVAPVFSHSRHTILGPTNATSLMVFSFFAASHGMLHSDPLFYMPLLVFLVGVICVIGALFKVADILQYVSQSVLVGYITGAAILILTNQTKHLFGIAQAMKEGDIPTTFFTISEKTISLWEQFQWQPIVLGGGTLLLYLILQKKAKKLPNFVICLTLSSLVAFFLRRSVPAFSELITFDPILISNLRITPPQFSIDNVSSLLGISFSIAFLASLVNTVMAKSLSSKSGDTTNANQDMLSLGMANIATSFIAPIPASGSLTRSALNYESGAQTRFASIFAGLIALAGFFLLLKAPIIENIPKASLAALVIGIAFSLINWNNILTCLQATRDDAVVIVATISSCLLLPRLDHAIFIGVGLSLALFLKKASSPHLSEYEFGEDGDLLEVEDKKTRQNASISIVNVEGELFFGAADIFRTQVQLATNDPNLKIIILQLKNARHMDATSVLALKELSKDIRKKGIHLLLSGVTRDVYLVLKKSKALQTIQEGCDPSKGETNVFMHFQSNPNISTRDALIRAKELLGNHETNIKIFFDANKKTS